MFIKSDQLKGCLCANIKNPSYNIVEVQIPTEPNVPHVIHKLYPVSNSLNYHQSNGYRKKSKELKMYYQNIKGIKTKLSLLQSTLPMFEHDRMLLSERWLEPNINCIELSFINHNVHRLNRSILTCAKSRGGGVLIAISEKYKVYIIIILCFI